MQQKRCSLLHLYFLSVRLIKLTKCKYGDIWKYAMNFRDMNRRLPLNNIFFNILVCKWMCVRVMKSGCVSQDYDKIYFPQLYSSPL